MVSICPGKNAKLSDKEYTKNSPIKVRLIRIDLGKGNVEILMTSLLDSNVHPTSQFKELYFKRWGVESFYDELKNKLRIEHFSGYYQSILQDFKAALFVSNVQTLIVSELEEDLKESNRDKKYDYKVNSNISYERNLNHHPLNRNYKFLQLRRTTNMKCDLFLVTCHSQF